jgi:DNA-binding response OmpR family regulator
MAATPQVILNAAGDPALRGTVSQVLRGQGFEVTEAANAEEACRAAAANPTLLILGPHPDGPEVCRRLKADPATAPVPCLYLFDDPTPVDNQPADGPDAFLGLPVHPVELTATVRLLLRAFRVAKGGRTGQGQGRKDGQLRREISGLRHLSHPPRTAVTARSFGLGPLREALPETFAELARHYGGLLDRALERRVYRVSQPLSEELRSLGERLGSLGAGPRDVVDLHRTALRGKGSATHAYVEEGRLLVLELMGHLASFYRQSFTGVRRPRPPDPHPREATKETPRA